MLMWIWLVACLASIYLYFRKTYSFFKKQNVNYLSPVPIFGNLSRSLFQMEHFTALISRLYCSFPNDRFVGYYEFINPVFVIRDPELIKQIAVKDFEHFLDHRVIIDENSDKFFGRNLFSLKGNKWRDMRSTLSPAFTGSKMKHMVPFMLECGKQMVDSLKMKFIRDGNSYLDLDTKDLCTRYANDVVASCAFGLTVNSLKEENNEFYRMGKIASTFTNVQLIKFFAYTAFPTVMNKLKISLFPKHSTSFFRNIITSTMRNREENNIIRPDMIHLLMEARKGTLTYESKEAEKDAGFATAEESSVSKVPTKRVWEEDDLIAQAMLFFAAGFDTVATVMAFTLYELALNPDIQENLKQEVDELNEIMGVVNYSNIQELKYMDMVISECLRKWSPGIISDRICVKPYNIGRANDKSTKDIIVQKGQGIWFPAWSIHRNPDYYPDPEKFDPERFSEENIHKIDPYTYIPFGVGPRNCIGSRFALIEAKIMIQHILTHFSVEPCARTTIPPVLSTKQAMALEGGHWLRLKIRK